MIDYRMASASRSYLPLLLGLLALALLGAGCAERARGSAKSTEPTLSKQAIVALVSQSIASSGLPEPPLRRDSTRTQRKEYLAAIQPALDLLKQVGRAKSENRPKTARLLLDDNTEQVLAISRMLAVEIADAIDRSDTDRTMAAIATASNYVDFVASRSVPDWLASATVADMLAVGVKSVSEQIDPEMADRIALEISKLEAKAANPAEVLRADSLRIEAWLDSVEHIEEAVTPESIELIAGVGPDARAANSNSFIEAVGKIAPGGVVAPDVFVAECRIAAEMVVVYLNDPRGPEPEVDSSRHPISAFLLTILQPTYSEASRLPQLRAENWRLLALTVKVAAADLPEDLSVMGELAISPVSQLPFEYVRRESDFDLARPRAKVGPTS